MADSNPSYLGAINNDVSTETAARALFLKVFSGEVLGAFNEKNVMFGDGGANGKHMVRTINSGKTAQFVVTGKATANYHTNLGSELTGTSINHAEREIHIDAQLIAQNFVSNFEEAMSHYEVRGEHAVQMGEALAVTGDRQLLQVVILASRGTAAITGGDGGSKVSHSDADSDGDVLGALIYSAGERMDEKDVPDMDRYVALRPSYYNLLVQSGKTIVDSANTKQFSSDTQLSYINKDIGGMGSIAMGRVKMINRMMILKSNNVPNSVIADVDGTYNTYNGDFSNVIAACWQKQAVGTVKLIGLKTEAEYLIEKQGTLMVAKYAMGHGILRPECAVEIATS